MLDLIAQAFSVWAGYRPFHGEGLAGRRSNSATGDSNE